MAVTKIDSNITGLAYAEESAVLGVLPGTAGADAIWRTVEPNSYAEFGGDIATVARSPINASRQRQKGTTTDLDAALGFNHDWVQHGLLRPAQSFFFAAAREKADTQKLSGATVPLSEVTTTTFAAAAGLGAFKANDIVLASGMGVVTNNGIKVLSAATATTLTTTGLTAEAAPPATARVQVVGVEFDEDDIDVDVVGTTAVNLLSTVYDFTTLGLTPGEWVFLGADSATNRFANNTGYARVASIAENTLSFDQTTWTAADETGMGKLIRMYFGTVLRNEKDPTLIKTKSLQFERSLGSDGIAPAAQTEYVIGAVGNELTLNMPQADKLNVDMSFVGINTAQRTSTQGPKAGTRVAVLPEDAFNTSSDIYRVRMNIVDPLTINNTALFGYVQEGNITINNGVTPNKALAVLGAFNVSAADFVAGGSITAYFTTVAAVAAIRNNADIAFNVICAKQNAGFVFDMPLLAIGGGRVSVEKDQPIMIPIENSAFENALGYTMMHCSFAYLPTTAMPAA